MRKIFIFAAVIFFILVSCSKEKVEENTTEKTLTAIESETPSIDLVGKWAFGNNETVEFSKDGTFLMQSSFGDSNTEVSGLFEQIGDFTILHVFENGTAVSSTVFLTFSRAHGNYSSLYFLAEDGSFLKYTKESDSAPEEKPVPYGIFCMSYKIDENLGIWSVLDFSDMKFYIISRSGEEGSMKILDFFVDGNDLYYPGGCYNFEVFGYEGLEYLFATESEGHSVFYKVYAENFDLQAIFPDDDFSFLSDSIPEEISFNPLCGVWTDEINDFHDHDGEVHKFGIKEYLVLGENNTFIWKTTESHGEELTTSTLYGNYDANIGTILFEIHDGEDQIAHSMKNYFIRQKEGYKVLYLMNEDGSFSYFTQKHSGEPEENPLLSGVYQSSPDWELHDGDFFMVNFDTMKVYIFNPNELSNLEEGQMLQPYLVKDIGRDGNHAYAIEQEGDFEAFRYGNIEYAFGVFSNGFHMTMWKDIENE